MHYHRNIERSNTTHHYRLRVTMVGTAMTLVVDWNACQHNVMLSSRHHAIRHVWPSVMILMGSTGKSTYCNVLVSTIHSDELKDHSNTICTHANNNHTVTCDMRLWCATCDATACRHAIQVRHATSDEQHEACNHERACASFCIAIAQCRTLDKMELMQYTS